MMAKITAKGQVTIPKKIRKMLGIESGDWIIFSVEGGKAMMYPVRGTLLELRGSLKPREVPENLNAVREEVKRKIAGRAVHEGLR
jgi:AbrB family looped-hinge helix DNA binding protein